MGEQVRGQQAARHWFSLGIEIPAVALRQVWDLVQPAEHAPLLDPQVIEGRTEGPEGIGQVQVFVHASGDDVHESRVEVTHHDPPWVAECRDLDTPFPSGTRCELRDLPTGTWLAVHVWAEPQGTPPPTPAAVLPTLEAYLLAVRRLLVTAPREDLPPPRPVPPPLQRQYARADRFLPRVAPERVWATIRPVEAARWEPGVVEAYVEPGTGPGVGEIQVFVRKARWKRVATRILVVDEVPPYFAATRTLTAEAATGTTFRISTEDGGCRLSVDQWVDLPPGHYAPELDREHERFTSGWFGWLERQLGS